MNYANLTEKNAYLEDAEALQRGTFFCHPNPRLVTRVGSLLYKCASPSLAGRAAPPASAKRLSYQRTRLKFWLGPGFGCQNIL